MEEFFTGQSTYLAGRKLPNADERDRLHDAHERRLEALDRVIEAAKKCGVTTDTDCDLILIQEEELEIFLTAEGEWGNLARAIGKLRKCLPIIPLERFGFPSASEDTLHESNPYLRRFGGGVEAWAFLAEDNSVYKFFRAIGNGKIGAAFSFQFFPSDEPRLLAAHCQGSYRDLFEKLRLIDSLGGMPAEVVAVTPEGIVITKQALGSILEQGEDVSDRLPPNLIPIPSRFLRANRDHPRLFFSNGQPWLVADLHARNFVHDLNGQLRLIDLIAAPWPESLVAREPLMVRWLENVRKNPSASALSSSHDDEL